MDVRLNHHPMEHSGRILFNADGNGKSYFLWNGTESYYKKLREAYKDIEEDKTTDYSFFSFFILCSATLEYSLNYTIADYCLEKYGPEDCKPYIEGYTSLNFKKKILMLPSILSDGELIFNQDTQTFKKLNELVNLRNKLMHGKELLGEFESPDITKINENGMIEFEIKTKPNPIDSLNKGNCVEFGKALGEFKRMIMEPWFAHELAENALLTKN